MLGPNIRPQVQTWGYARRAITGADTITASDRGYVVDATSGTFSLALTAGATLGTGFEVAVYNSGTGIVTVDPAGVETILLPSGSASTVALSQGMGFLLMWNGTLWEAIASSGFGPHGSLYTASRIVQTDTTGALATPSALASDQSLSLTNASGIQTQQASTQDAIRLLGRAGGTSSYSNTLTTATLAGNVTCTLPATTTTLAGLAVAQTFTVTQAISGDLQLTGGNRSINAGTSDGSDNRFLSFAGGGAATSTRGAFVNFIGNEFATASFQGCFEFVAGNDAGFSSVAAGSVRISVGGGEWLRLWRTGGLELRNGPTTDPGAGNISANGLAIYGTTDSTSKDTGSIVTEGGIGAEKQITAGTGFRTGSTTLMTSSVAFTNGAGANTGTLTNSPATGNPTKWIPVNDNGTTRYIPAW